MIASQRTFRLRHSRQAAQIEEDKSAVVLRSSVYHSELKQL